MEISFLVPPGAFEVPNSSVLGKTAIQSQIVSMSSNLVIKIVENLKSPWNQNKVFLQVLVNIVYTVKQEGQ